MLICLPPGRFNYSLVYTLAVISQHWPLGRWLAAFARGSCGTVWYPRACLPRGCMKTPVGVPSFPQVVDLLPVTSPIAVPALLFFGRWGTASEGGISSDWTQGFRRGDVSIMKSCGSVEVRTNEHPHYLISSGKG
jgi:hypothetical protein